MPKTEHSSESLSYKPGYGPGGNPSTIVGELNQLAKLIHERNRVWWYTEDGVKLERNVPEMLCLVHSEISEGMEGYRKNLKDDKLPHRSMLEVELADAVIRIMDMAAGLDLDLGGALVEKLEYNKSRADHTYAARKENNGKKF